MPPPLRTGSIHLNPGDEMTVLQLRQVQAERKKDDQVQYLLPTGQSLLPVLRTPPPPVSFSYSRSPPAPAVGTEDAKTSQTQKILLSGRAWF